MQTQQQVKLELYHGKYLQQTWYLPNKAIAYSTRNEMIKNNKLYSTSNFKIS